MCYSFVDFFYCALSPLSHTHISNCNKNANVAKKNLKIYVDVFSDFDELLDKEEFRNIEKIKVTTLRFTETITFFFVLTKTSRLNVLYK